MQSSLNHFFHQPATHTARSVHLSLFRGYATGCELDFAAHYLAEKLEEASTIDADLPHDMNGLADWMAAGVERVGQEYRQYLDARKAGGERRYFRNHSHALYFLKSVAPTKMVDGAWLYGLLPHWQDTRFLSLIQTYLEELGEGLPTKNHVVLYKRLLASQGCEHWDDLGDEHYVQGAIQLSLAYHAERFLPEVIGFNLGYEQLPLHLLITAYELKELGIDPYYFTLHITVDNADSGHARKAVDAVFDAMPRFGDAQEFYRRVCNGYKLNLLGASTKSVIESFDLNDEMCIIFSRKGTIGQYAHSDYRRIAGRTINEWLSDTNQTGALIGAMEQEGWFKRHQDPQNSRFWRLIQSENAKMFGVFSTYEQQVIYDWILGDVGSDRGLSLKNPLPVRRHLSVKDRRQYRDMPNQADKQDAANEEANDFDAEARAVEEKFATMDRKAGMSMLISLMSPTNHHSAPGLAATRIFNEILS